MTPSIERIREVLSYDPETGVLTWKVATARRIRVGDVAGKIAARGYVIVGIDGKQLRAHRLIWAIMTGAWPEGDIDHRDTCRTNNRWKNLRPATFTQNRRNANARKDSHTGVKGVTFSKQAQKFLAYIRVDRKVIHGGSFDTLEAAAARRAEMSAQYHGDFAR